MNESLVAPSQSISPALLLADTFTRNTRIECQADVGSKATNFQIDFDSNFPDAARTALEYAANVWHFRLTSVTTVTCRIHAIWKPLQNRNALAQAYTTAFGTFGGAIHPVAVANRVRNRDLWPNEPHIVIEVNSDFANFHFEPDGECPGDQYDLASVLLHELGHGLGFFSSFRMLDESSGTWGENLGDGVVRPFWFDRFLIEGRYFEENVIVNRTQGECGYPNPSQRLLWAMCSDAIYFNGPGARLRNGGYNVQLYAPRVWRPGSSLSHLDENEFRWGPNTLMTPSIAMGEVIHDPGNVAIKILREIGWAW